MNLGQMNLVPPATFETGIALLTVADAALADARARHFAIPPAPLHQQYHGVLPDIVHLSDDALGALLGEISAWATYAEGQLAIAKHAKNRAEGILEFTRSRIRLALKADDNTRKLSNPDKDDLVNTDPRVLESARDFMFCEALFDLTKLHVTAAQRDWDTVSRRITQRGQEVERLKREANLQQGNIPVSATAFRRG